MREVHLVANESTATSLVFRAADSDEEFFLAVDDSLLEILTSPDDVFHQTLPAPRVVEHEEPVELPVATTELEPPEKQQNVDGGHTAGDAEPPEKSTGASSWSHPGRRRG